MTVWYGFFITSNVYFIEFFILAKQFPAAYLSDRILQPLVESCHLNVAAGKIVKMYLCVNFFAWGGMGEVDTKAKSRFLVKMLTSATLWLQSFL